LDRNLAPLQDLHTGSNPQTAKLLAKHLKTSDGSGKSAANPMEEATGCRLCVGLGKNLLRNSNFAVFSRAHRNYGWTTGGLRPKRTSRRSKRD
jgi:hypothetical protein